MRRDFVANVSHELRTPLSILRGYLETLLENPKQPPAELLRIFETMERHSNRLNLLVDDVLSLARLEGPGVALDLTTVRPAPFLRGIMHDWERKFAEKNLQTELDVSENLPPLRVDEGRMQEVIYNLLDNAVKFSPPKGRIRVSATRNDNLISLSVSDCGTGIPARDLPRIFERFYRADKARHRELGGTGARSLDRKTYCADCMAAVSRRKVNLGAGRPSESICRLPSRNRNTKNFARFPARLHPLAWSLPRLFRLPQPRKRRVTAAGA
jgi:two-component system phosphate regulon sensor histidine kinase PhoR